jgi:hypothetical protein
MLNHPQSHPGTFPIHDPQTSAAQAAADLHTRWSTATERASALEGERAAAHIAVRTLTADLEAELTAAARDGKTTTRKATDLAARLQAAEQTAAEPWPARIRAASAAAESIRSDYIAHIEATLEQLLSEPSFAAEAEQARERVLAAAAELDAALAELDAVGTRVGALVAHTQHLNAADLRRPDTAALTRELAALLGLDDNDLDQVLPRPLPDERVMEWRRNAMTGTLEPSTLTNL